MTKLSMTIAVATLTVSLAQTAQAYAVEPEAAVFEQSVVEQINVLIGAVPDSPAGTCELSLTPVLAEALGIPVPLNEQDKSVALASCEAE